VAETLLVHLLFDGAPSRAAVADVLRYCNEGVHPEHPRREELVVPEEQVERVAADLLAGGRVRSQYGEPGDSPPCTFDYSLAVHPEGTDDVPVPGVALSVTDAYFRTTSGTTPEAARSATAALRAFLRGLYERAVERGHRPRYLCAVDWPGFEHPPAGRPLVSREALDTGTVGNWWWWQVLGPGVADAVGRGRLRAAPAWRLRELDDGSVLLAVDELPNLPHLGLERTNLDAVLEHFDVEPV
jgi:hypothetical protein